MNANNLSEIPLGGLSIFVAVAECEGFSAAARRLGVSKSMVSATISRLEERLGVMLFQRTTRRIALTEAGAAALPHAQRALLAVRDAEEAATSGLTAPRGTVRVNAPMSFGLEKVAPALGEFARAYPELKVDLVLDDRVLDLVEGGFDVALRIGDLPDSTLVAQRLATNRMTIVAHADYLERRGTPARPSQLEEHDALVYTLSPTGSRWTLSKGSRKETVRVRGSIQANSSLALREAVRAGVGLARIPRFLVDDDLAAGRLVRLLPDWTLPQQGIYALTTTRDVPLKARAFIDFYRERLGEGEREASPRPDAP